MLLILCVILRAHRDFSVVFARVFYVSFRKCSSNRFLRALPTAVDRKPSWPHPERVHPQRAKDLWQGKRVLAVHSGLWCAYVCNFFKW